MRARCLGGFFVMWVPKLLLSPVKVFFLLKNNPFWPEIGIFGYFGPGLDGSIGALLAGLLVILARRLYLARHLFTLWY